MAIMIDICLRILESIEQVDVHKGFKQLLVIQETLSECCGGLVTKSCLTLVIPWAAACQASLAAQLVKNQPAMQETLVRSLGQEDPLEKEMATHSSILAWRIPWTEEPGRLQSMGSQESDTT